MRRGLRPCARKKEQDCDAEGATDLLPKKRTELDQIILAKAQGLIGGCAQKRGLCIFMYSFCLDSALVWELLNNSKLILLVSIALESSYSLLAHP